MSCGIRKWGEAELLDQGLFFFDKETGRVQLYSTKNPAEVYTDIECALKKHIIRVNQYVICDGLRVAYGAAHGITGSNTHHVIIRNCDISFIGGGRQHGRVRYGNGIEFWASAHDNIVEGCRIWDIYDAGWTNQSAGQSKEFNIYYRNNIIWNCEYSFEYWNRPETSLTHDIYFENNICFDAGKGWSNRQRPWAAGVDIMFFKNPAKTYNFYIRNNVFSNAKHSTINLNVKQWPDLDKLVLDNNTYYQTKDKRFISWGKAQYKVTDFEKYKQETGKDGNSRVIILENKIQ